MSSPFHIEEIFPDDAGHTVRLPRRQTGNAPQGLVVTLLADYTVRTGAWLPSAALVALLAEAGVSAAGARTAISRLVRRGVLDGSRQGRHSFYRLSRPAAVNLSVGGRWIVTATDPTTAWDGQWTLVAFSLPQDHGTQRRNLRHQLRWLGYAPLYDGLWISPHEVTPPVRAHLAQLTLGAVTVFRGRQAELDTLAGRDPLDAWDVAAIARHYESFLRRWRPLLPRVTSGQVGGAEAVQARTEVMDTFRRFPVLDPQLPTEILPPGWLREPARQVFAAVYDGLAHPAERHVRAVVARFADQEQPGIRAHTTADLLAGLGPGEAPACGDGTIPDAAGSGRVPS
ncbi:PaaX family transcriptional regulator [Micromonospora sp. WMMD882]|uniref:PaaX family transcriptional regulator n=1 Tax=Micromonospora sp. WMMD882 TaxID=3015151 RepID=UPI00248C161B|nr:PaaX family transcriptional regulator C-terminal domain-containing protein [Micromonospora sp. WMMD882]WBB81002.1 PaaX family transcriptional regulator [Micromonospora sp. WMMD882]